MDQRFVAEHVHEINAHLLALAGHPGAEEILVRKRIGVFILGLYGLESVVVAMADEVHGGGGPGAKDGFAAVGAQAPVQQRQHAPGTVVAGGKRADHHPAAGNRPGLDLRPRRGRVVAVVDRVVRAVGIASPEPLGIAEIAVHVLPAIVDHPPVGQHRAVPFVQRAVADLPEVGPVGADGKQVAHDVPVAHAVLGLAGRGEEDAAVRQVERIDVGNARAARELSQSAAVGMDLVKVIVVLAVAAHGQEDRPAVVAHLRIAGDALGEIDQRRDGNGVPPPCGLGRNRRSFMAPGP